VKAPAIIEDSDDTPLPSSWLRVSFDDVFLNQTSSDRKIPLSEYLSEGAFPIVDQGQAAIGGYTNRAELVSLSPLPAIIFGDHTRAIKWCDRPFVQGADGVRVLTTSTMALPRFGYWALKNTSLPDKGYSRHYKFLRASVVPIPPVAEQARIIEKIDTLHARSERARRALFELPALLERLRQSVLTAAFRGTLTAAWRTRNPNIEPADKLLEKIRTERRRRWEEAELARLTAKGKPPNDDRWKARYAEPMQMGASHALPTLPDGWSWVAFDELVEVFDSKRIPLNLEQRSVRKGPYPYYGASGIIDHVDDYLFDGDYLLIAEDGANLLSRSSPRAFSAGGKFWVNNHAHIVKAVRPLGHDFIQYFINTISLAPFVTGTAQPKLTQKSLAQIPVPLPPEAEVEQIIVLIDKLFAPLNSQVQGAHSLGGMLDELDARILAKAFRGELVPQNPEDEPASVLLSRLRDDAAMSPAKPRRARTPVPLDNSAAAESEPVPAWPAPAPLTTTVPVEVDAQPALARQHLLAVPPPQQCLRLAAPIADFVDLPADAQAAQVHSILLGEGPLGREDAIRRAAELLRDARQASFQRLRRDGTLAACIDASLAVGLRQGHFDRPRPGTVRAVAGEAAQVPPELWRRALLASLASPAADDDAAVRAAAAWSQAQFGLEFQRLRTGGHIDTALRAALAELLAAGEVTRDRNGALTLHTRTR